MDDELMIKVDFRKGTIETNREPKTEEEKIRIQLIEQNMAIRDMMRKNKEKD